MRGRQCADPAGSSPLTRGKPREAVDVPRSQGLIPAHAGKTRGAVNDALAPAAHPRSRGENITIRPAGTNSTGSSPLTRGKPGLGGKNEMHVGLIPAHTGKTRAPSRSRFYWRAHPRSHGENDHVAEFLAATPGSSPLTRGKRRGCRFRPSSRRLIPAHAGKTGGR